VFVEQAEEKDSLRGRVAREVHFPASGAGCDADTPIAECKPHVAPCRAACPLGQDVPGYVKAIAEGNPARALEIIRRTNPFPAVCGRLCPASCMRACVRHTLDEGVHIRALKRFAADAALHDVNAFGKKASAGDKKVAVIGGGPAGLSAAWSLARAGWKVEVFESAAKPGGLLWRACADFDLPKVILQKEIDAITALGVTLHLEKPIHGRRPLARLHESGFDAVIVASGASRALGLDLDGWGRIQGTWDVVSFAAAINDNTLENMEGPVVVSGGGPAAISAARMARRACRQAVYLVLPRAERETPAPAGSLERARREGVTILAEQKVIGMHGNPALEGVKIAPQRLSFPGPTNKRTSLGVQHKKAQTYHARHVVGAALRLGDTEWLNGEPVVVGPLGNLISPDGTHNLGPAWLFGAGEALTGAKTVVEAIATGLSAARQAARYLTSLKA
jgi:glutamate synthase (NADPH/NADH) small chain